MNLNIFPLVDAPSVLNFDGNKFHENIFRSYQILELVKKLLKANTSPEIVLSIIDEIQALPQLEEEHWHGSNNYMIGTKPVEKVSRD